MKLLPTVTIGLMLTFLMSCSSDDDQSLQSEAEDRLRLTRYVHGIGGVSVPEGESLVWQLTLDSLHVASGEDYRGEMPFYLRPGSYRADASSDSLIVYNPGATISDSPDTTNALVLTRLVDNDLVKYLYTDRSTEIYEATFERL